MIMRITKKRTRKDRARIDKMLQAIQWPISAEREEEKDAKRQRAWQRNQASGDEYDQRRKREREMTTENDAKDKERKARCKRREQERQELRRTIKGVLVKDPCSLWVLPLNSLSPPIQKKEDTKEQKAKTRLTDQHAGAERQGQPNSPSHEDQSKPLNRRNAKGEGERGTKWWIKTKSKDETKGGSEWGTRK